MDESRFILSYSNENLLSKITHEDDEFQAVRTRITKRMRTTLTSLKIREGIELDDFDKKQDASRNELKSYFEKISKDPNLKKLLE